MTVAAVAVVLALGVALYAVMYRQSPPTLPAAIDVAPGAAAGFNVVLVTLDTLRADRVGCYGYREVETPVLDALAGGGVRFTDAVTAVPLTLPSHSTILTGNYPPTHGVRNNGTYRLVAGQTTLTERLKAAGYATAAFIAAFVLDNRYGTNQGFDVYDDAIDLRHRSRGSARDSLPQQPGDVVTDAALDWLDHYQRSEARQPFFMWVHLFDPHTPYEPPEPFRTRYASDLYVGEVAFTDQQVGRLVSRLGDLKLLDNTLVVVVGDHGEGLGDHGESTHGLLIYASTMWVPLILHAPTVIPGGQVVDDRVVATADIAPTILDLLGLEPGECDGVSLLRARATPDRAVYMETLAPQLDRGWSALRGLRRHTDKYIEAPTPEYYDLSADLGEEHNLFTEDGPAGKLRAGLTELLASFPAEDEVEEARVTPDEEALRKLRALGYVGGGPPVVAGPPLDPKEVILRWQRQYERIQSALGQGRYRDVIPLAKEILADTPDDGDMWSVLSTTQARAGLIDQAIESRLKSIELQPRNVYHWIDLARLQRHKGDLAAMQVSLAEAERIEPDCGEIYVLRAQLALHAERFQEAIHSCEEARKRDPTRQTAPAWSMEARVYEATGRLDEARSAYMRAREADPRDPGALIGLMKLAERGGDCERVIELGREVAPGDEQWPESQRLLAQVHLRLGQGDKAVQVVRELAKTMPDSAWAQRQLGNVLAMLERTAEAVVAYRKAVEVDPHDAVAQYRLARALSAEGDMQASIAHLRKAVSLKPDYLPALQELAELLEVTGQAEEAARVRSRIESLANPDHSHRRERGERSVLSNKKL